MPTVLYTFHAKLSWLPDRPQGYVRRGEGVLPPDPEMADVYLRQATAKAVLFDERHQQAMIDAVIEASRFQRFAVHAVATETSHVHILISWRDDRDGSRVRRTLRASLTRQLNAVFGRREWFSDGASSKCVIDIDHFDHLIGEYLPKHTGLSFFDHDAIPDP